MQPVLFDSSIYISALRTAEHAVLTLRRLAADAPVWLCSVVLEELYALVQARGPGTLSSDWIVISTGPNASWCRILVTGRKRVKCSPAWAAKYDYEKIGRGRLTNDALIAIVRADWG